MISQLKLRHKLVATNLVAAVMVLSISGGLFVWRSGQQQQSAFEQRVERQGILVAENIQAAVLFEDWSSAEEIISAFSADDAILSVRLIDAFGTDRVEYSQATLVSDLNMNDQFVISVPVLLSDKPIARLELVASDLEVGQGIRRGVVEISLLIVLTLICGSFLVSRMQRIVTAPILRLSDFVRGVRETGNYSLRIQSEFQDDIGGLTDDVNRMMNIIETRETELERIVSQRTQALALRNDQLHKEIKQREEAERLRLESQLRFERIFENAPIGLAIVDTDHCIIQRNAVFDEILDSVDVVDPRLSSYFKFDSLQRMEKEMLLLQSGGDYLSHWEEDCTTVSGRNVSCVFSLSVIHSGDEDMLYVVLQIQDVTEAKQLTDKLNYQASHDVLTGLANRRTFETAIETANDLCRSDGITFALCLIDLDQFKVVNDTAGHAAGDDLLKLIAITLRESVRPDDLVVRLGGDEFAILLKGCDVESAKIIAEELRSAIYALLFERNGLVFRIGASVGLVEVETPAADIGEILRDADMACFAAKDAGRNQVQVVEPNRGALSEKKGEMHWVQRIHRAIEQDDFILYAQPVVPLQGQIEPQRLEILVRLRNRVNNSLYPPGAFLPVAERYDLSSQIDEWVVRNVIKSLQTYVYLFDESRTYWINLSGHSIGDERFLDFLEQAIRSADVPPGVINFEITETAVIRNIKMAVGAMHRLKKLGCRFALDDFGAGLSSFGYLKALPVDYLKIDGSFVRGIAEQKVDRIFVKSIIDIATAMNIQSVVEFVESEEIAEIVTELGANYGQGFALGRPAQLLPESAMKIMRDTG